jgi:hypothetical protein
MDDHVIRYFATQLAKTQLADRNVHTEVLHLLIARFVALHPPDKPSTPRRKKIAIQAAMDHYGVSERTVREAMRKAAARG